MPVISLGTWQYNDTVAQDAIAKGLKAGFTHIDTAMNYNNQKGVGLALKGLDRDSFFLTTKTVPCTLVPSAAAAACASSKISDLSAHCSCAHRHMTEAACEAQATSDFLGDLSDLGLDHVDLILLHGPSHRGAGTCDKASCTKDLGQVRTLLNSISRRISAHSRLIH